MIKVLTCKHHVKLEGSVFELIDNDVLDEHGEGLTNGRGTIALGFSS